MIAAGLQAFPKQLLFALSKLGVKEIPGERDNPEIVAFHAETAAGAAPDEVAWCSSFVNWCMARAGIRGTRNKAAASWATWGYASALRVGAVVYFGKADPDAMGTGHVALVVAWDEQSLYVVGGNQGNQVSVAKRPRSALDACRWPIGVP